MKVAQTPYDYVRQYGDPVGASIGQRHVAGSGKRCFGPVHAQYLLEDPDVVLQGSRGLPLRYRVRR
ncbi:hypothetical protein ACOM2C_17315 [Pseudarthrobacter sp. So.54]